MVTASTVRTRIIAPASSRHAEAERTRSSDSRQARLRVHGHNSSLAGPAPGRARPPWPPPAWPRAGRSTRPVSAHPWCQQGRSCLREGEGLEPWARSTDGLDVDPTRACGSRAARATATPSACAIEIGGYGPVFNSGAIAQEGGLADRPRSRDRPGSGAATPARARGDARPPWPRSGPRAGVCVGSRGHPGRDSAACSSGPSWVCSRTSRQTGRAMSPGGASQTAHGVAERDAGQAAIPRRSGSCRATGRRRDTAQASRTASLPSRGSASRLGRRDGPARHRRTRDAAAPHGSGSGMRLGVPIAGADPWIDSRPIRSGKMTSPCSRQSRPQHPSRWVNVSRTIGSVWNAAARPEGGVPRAGARRSSPRCRRG